MEKEYKPIPRFNDHGSACKGHANAMLDCEYTKQEERDLLSNVLTHYINKNEKELA
jgi:hypothetical protein